MNNKGVDQPKHLQSDWNHNALLVHVHTNVPNKRMVNHCGIDLPKKGVVSRHDHV